MDIPVYFFTYKTVKFGIEESYAGAPLRNANYVKIKTVSPNPNTKQATKSLYTKYIYEMVLPQAVVSLPV